MDPNLFNAATQDFSLPHDVVPLPSGGLFYKNKKKTVKVGYLTANDENILMGTSQSSNQNIVLTLLRNKIYEHDLRPEELLESDIEAILIFLRNTSFGPEYKINLVDPKTNKTFETTIILDELDITPTQHLPDENGMFTTKLPRSGSTVKLKPMTYTDIIELDKMVEQYPMGRVAPSITWRLNKIIQEVDGVSDREKIAPFIDTLPIVDSKYIRNFVRENVPSLNLQKVVYAPSGERVMFNITFGVEFFRPFF
jgi:hypothetical protein